MEFKDPETPPRFERLKQCFPLFRVIAGNFERLQNKTWIVRTHSNSETWCGTDSPRWGSGEFYVPKNLPHNDECSECKFLMECMMHEFYERWAIEIAGWDQMGPAGNANNMAEHFEGLVPVEECCKCDCSPKE